MLKIKCIDSTPTHNQGTNFTSSWKEPSRASCLRFQRNPDLVVIPLLVAEVGDATPLMSTFAFATLPV